MSQISQEINQKIDAVTKSSLVEQAKLNATRSPGSQTYSGTLPELPKKEIRSKESGAPVESVILKDRLPAKIQAITDCNELRRELLTLMQQTKQMEFRVRKEEEKVSKAAKQLVEEHERPNEEILAQKRNEKFRIEKTIEAVRNKTAQIKPVDIAVERQRYEAEMNKQADFYNFASNVDLLRQIVDIKLAEVQRGNFQAALDASQRMKQPILQSILNDLQNEEKTLQKQCDGRVYEVIQKLKELCAVQHPTDPEFRTDYKRKLENIRAFLIDYNTPEATQALHECGLEEPLVGADDNPEHAFDSLATLVKSATASNLRPEEK